MSISRGTGCNAHKHRTPVPLENHHIWPQAFHGPTRPDNLTMICSNAHGDVHYYMNYLLRNNGAKPDDWRTYAPSTRKIAIEGYHRVMAYATTTALAIEAAREVARKRQRALLGLRSQTEG